MTTANATAFPSTPAELEEFLHDDKRRGDALKDAESTAQFLSNYQASFGKKDKGELAKQIADATSAGIVAAMREMGAGQLPGNIDLTNGADPRMSIKDLPSKGTGAEKAARHNPNAPGARMDSVFDSLGDFLATVDPRNQAVGGGARAEKLSKARQVMNAYSSFDPASAGFLIPEEFRSEIMGLVLEQSTVRPRATVIPMGTQTLSMPFVDETTHSGSLFGGMTFAWGAEAASIAVSEAKFGRVRLEANKLVGGATIPNELMADAPALTAWLNARLPEGIAWYEDKAFLDGDGGMMPLGVYNSPAMVTVSKETNQPADTVVFDNVAKMFSRMLPSSLSSAVWVANQTLIPQLLSLSIAVGTGGAPVMLVDAHATPNWTMLGRPIIFTEKAPTIGDLNDLAFVDFRYYLIGDRQAVSVESSEHSQFMADSTQIRVIDRVDGRPWIQSALTPANGSTLSPFVNLQAR